MKAQHQPAPAEIPGNLAFAFQRQNADVASVPGTVLFVDDEAELQFLVALYFEHHGLKVLAAHNATEAVREIDAAPVDAIILDVSLSGANVPELMGRLKNIHPRAPVILYTGRSKDDEAVTGLLNQGADRYFPKDGSLEGLLAAVREHLKS